jgi:hypothetical protein
MKHSITKNNITKTCDDRNVNEYLRRGWKLDGKTESKLVVKKSELEELTVKQLTEKINELGVNPKSSSTKSDLIDILIELEKG